MISGMNWLWRRVLALWVRFKVLPEDAAAQLRGRPRPLCYVLEQRSSTLAWRCGSRDREGASAAARTICALISGSRSRVASSGGGSTGDRRGSSR